MYKHILIPIDGSQTAAKAIAAGIELAGGQKAKVTMFTAVPEYQPPSEADIAGRRQVVSLWDHERLSRDKAQAILQPAAEQVRAAGLDCDTAYAECNRPYEAIVEAAESRGCDLIVMASHGRSGLSELWYGSQTREVLTHSDIPTLVYR